jgi:hypothetical protein
MMMHRIFRPLLFTGALCVALSAGGDVFGGTLSVGGKEPQGVVHEDAWSFYGSLSGYVVPDDSDYLSPLLTADRDWFHFEARYNYESLETASMWLGYNFACDLGEHWTLEFTPMVGGVFGDTSGVAPGWRLGLNRGKLDFTSEAEFVFDSESSADHFFYAWSELTWSFTDSFWVGLALQRTRAYQTDLDIQRGILVGFAVHDVEFTTYVFNWGWDDPLLVFSVGMNF